MVNPGVRCLLLVLILPAAIAVQATVYQWTDELGRQHYSDRPPDQSDVDFERRLYELENLDEGYPDPVVHNPPTREQRQQIEQQRQARQKALQQACQRARQKLWVLKGRVTYRDSQGEAVYVSEAGRKAHVARLDAAIRQRCS